MSATASFDLTSVRRGAGGRLLADYAADPASSRGRLIDEPASPTRTVFQRDRDRIIHSNAFRRLKHKTQVFVHHEEDHFRTRLTHTIEVGQIARGLARALCVDEDLAEALALVHDFGHTPFGHAGERVLNDKLASFGGFEHNAQSLRIVTELERRYPKFDGLNLCWETLEGLVKHNGPLTDRKGDGLEGSVPASTLDYNARHDLALWSWPSVEAQCAAIADDIAYNSHDLDDGLRAGLFRLGDLMDVPLWAHMLTEIRSSYPDLDDERTANELVRRQITLMVEDVIRESLSRIQKQSLSSVEAVRTLGSPIVAFSPQMDAEEKVLKKFLFTQMYRHPVVTAATSAAESILGDLYAAFFSGRGLMPATQDWTLEGLDEAARAQRVADYLSGMTDRFAIREHQRLFDHTPELR